MAARKHRRSRQHRAADADEAAPAGPRPIWSGTISFGLVAVPVDLFPAVRSGGTAMRMLSPEGTPLQRRYFCPEDERDVGWDELVRGFETDQGTHVQLDDDELEAIAPRKSRDIDLRRFVPEGELDPFLFERAYVLTPGGDSSKPYRLLAAAMQDKGKAGIATFVMRQKEYLVAILARDGILWAETLRFAGELRTPKQVGLPAAKKPAKKAVDGFVQAIGRLAEAQLDRDELHDRRQQALQQLVAKKQKRGEDVVEAEAPAAAEADGEAGGVDLFEAIRSSLRLVAGGKQKRAAAASGRDGLSKLSKQALYERAKQAGVEGRSGMSKQQLVAALQHAG